MNRINKKKKKDNLGDLRTFFLACEFKPGSTLFSVLDPFAYDIKPAFIHGSLGVLSYKPETYSIIDVNDESEPLLGYVMTITHPDTVLLLDKIKGFNGDSFNVHTRKLVHAFTDVHDVVNAWCYQISSHVLDAFESIEQVELGLWDESDDKQIALLEKIGESLE